MQAYEFQTTSKDGVIIIPDKFDKISNTKVRVIVLAEEKNTINKRNIFPDFAIDTTDYVFSREEANER